MELKQPAHNISTGPRYGADIIETAALAYEFGRLLNMAPTTDYIESYGTSYDRLLGASLRLAILVASLIDETLECYEDGVFTYECIELPLKMELDITLTSDTLTIAVWNRMEQNDWFQLAENFVTPKWLGEVVRGWFLALPEGYCQLREGVRP